MAIEVPENPKESVFLQEERHENETIPPDAGWRTEFLVLFEYLD